VWPAVYLPLAVSVAVTLLVACRSAPPASRALVRLGLVLLATSVAAEVLSAPWSTADTHAGLVHAVEGALEEGLELGGWGLVATGLLAWATTTLRAPAHVRLLSKKSRTP